MSAVVIVALLAILAMNWGLQGIQRPEPDDGEFRNEAGIKSCRRWKIMRWSFRIWKDSLSEDYLTRAYAFAYIIEQNPEVLWQPVRTGEDCPAA